MAVQSRNMHATDAAATAHYRGEPIDRFWLDLVYPWFRAVLGVIFVAFCAISTIYGVHDDLEGVIVANDTLVRRYTGLDPHTAGYTLGVLAASAIFIGEVLTGERHPLVYLAILAADVYYSQNFTGPIADFVIPDGQPALHLVEWAAGLIAAVIVAYYGERLLFGRRRRLGRHS